MLLIRSRAGGDIEHRDVFLTASAKAYQKHVLHGQKTVSIIIANLHAILTIFYFFIADYDSERVCRWGVFLNSVRPMASTPFDAFPF